MKTTLLTITLALAAVFGVSSCVEKAQTSKQKERVAQIKAEREKPEPEVLSGPGWYGHLQRFHDTQAKVTCWLYREGLSCLPDNTYEGDVP
jgi:hypothetical protein